MNSIKSSAALIALALSFPAFSQPTVQLHGEIVRATCVIEDTATNKIDLGSFDVSKLMRSGSSEPVRFSLVLGECSSFDKTVMIAMHADSSDGYYIHNQGTAGGVAITLSSFNNSRDAIRVDGSPLQWEINPTHRGQAAMEFAARIHKSADTVTPGTISAAVTYDVVYE